jgi:hypothetical protein
VFDDVVAALVHGSGYERVATLGCSDRTIRRRLDDWAEAGVGEQVLRSALPAIDVSGVGWWWAGLASGREREPG